VNKPFIHLRLHSAYSLAEGALTIKQIPKLCVEKGMPAVGITDTHNMFGALEFAVACADTGIQPLVGCQVNVTAASQKSEQNPGENIGNTLGQGDDATDHKAHAKAKAHPDQIVLLCQSDQGYLNLMQLVSDSYFNLDPTYPPQVDFNTLANHAEGLICLNGGKRSSLYRLLALRHVDEAVAQAAAYKKCFGDRFYIEIQRHGVFEESAIEEELLKIADSLYIPIVATNDVFFRDKDMYRAHDALLCIADGRYVSETERRKVTPEHYFKSAEAMTALFSDVPEAIHNTHVIARRCHTMPLPRKPILPSYESKDGRDEVEELRYQANAGLRDRLKHLPEVPKDYQERLDFELGVIEAMGFPGYFLIVADFIKFAKSQHIPVGPGRGSGAGSLVAWSLTITDMDPIRFGLIFERFLNPERVSMPDFDIDFCQERRDEVIEYVRQKYGNDRVAHIITFGKLQARAVLRDVGRVMQMPYGQVDKISKLIPNNPANPVTLAQALTGCGISSILVCSLRVCTAMRPNMPPVL
jgi:DNA polymerase-3 subunit alpha